MATTKRVPVLKPKPVLRDTTRALAMAHILSGALSALVPDQGARLHMTAHALVDLLRDMDARTGKRDPSKRKKR